MLPITLRDVALSFPHKVCFEHVSVVLSPYSKIGLMGQNGCGKSTLLRMLCGLLSCPEGEVNIPSHTRIVYVPQILPAPEILPAPGCSVQRSGGESFYQMIREAFAQKPDVLLLDEPSNHLDQQHRADLFRLMAAYNGTLVVASHDGELLSRMDVLWHIHEGTLTVFNGSFADYLAVQQTQRTQKENEEKVLRLRQNKLKEAIQKKQTKTARSRHQGVKKFGNDKMQLGNIKSWGEQNSGKALQRMRSEHSEVEEKLKFSRKIEEVQPRFQLCGEAGGQKNIVTIAEGAVFLGDKQVLKEISLSISNQERIALHGRNGSGKSTLLQAIMHSPETVRKGFWNVPPPEHVCYLDQRYSLLLNAMKKGCTVLNLVRESMPDSAYADIRRHLSDFLFKKNEEANCLISLLSGGEQARLCLAVLAARSPRLLLLDEMTNNLDRETRHHVITVLQKFSGALILVSHDSDFLDSVQITTHYYIQNGLLKKN